MARWWRRGAQAPTATPARESAPPPAPPHSAPIQRAEWRDVPPLRPVVTAIPTVAPSDTFAQTLAAWQNPSFLQPLGHAVDPAGPAGHVDGLAVPTAPRTVSGGADLQVANRPPGRTATVQRAAGPWLGPAEPPTALGADTDSGEPPPRNGFTADGWEEPRTLSVAPAPTSGRELTVAPELPVRSSLPAVPRPLASSFPTAAPGTPTVSEPVVDDGHRRARPGCGVRRRGRGPAGACRSRNRATDRRPGGQPDRCDEPIARRCGRQRSSHNGSRRHLVGDRDAAGRRQSADRRQPGTVDGAAIRRRSHTPGAGSGCAASDGAGRTTGAAGRSRRRSSEPWQRPFRRARRRRHPDCPPPV